MTVLLLAAGRQSRWQESGGDGFKQQITVDGEPIVHRTFRLAAAAGFDVVTLVQDPGLDCWQGLYPARPSPEPWMGEMGKFLDGRAYWPAAGLVTILYGDVFYTEATLDLILGHVPDQPTVYGRARARGRRLESFGFRFDVADGDEIERVARAAADAGMNQRGGPWRWFHKRHLPELNTYDANRVRQLATEANGWVELPPDETDDFDRLADLESWRARFGRCP